MQCVFLVSYLSIQFRKTCTWNNAFNPIFYLACILWTFLKKKKKIQTVSVAICVLSSSYFSVVRLNIRYGIFNSFPNNVNYNLISISLSVSRRSWIWHCVGHSHKLLPNNLSLFTVKPTLSKLLQNQFNSFVLTKNEALLSTFWNMLRNIFSNSK